MIRIYGILAAILLSALTDTAHASAIADCGAVAKYNITRFNHDFAARASLLSLITENNYKDAAANGSLNFLLPEGVPVGLEWKDVEKRIHEFFAKTQIDLETEESVGLLTYALSHEATDAFTKCVDAILKHGGITITDVAHVKGYTQVRVTFQPSTGTTGPYTVRATVQGGQFEDGLQRLSEMVKSIDSHGDALFQIERALLAGGKPDIIRFKVEAPDIDKEDGILVPAPFALVEKVDENWKHGDTSSARGGWDRPSKYWGNQVYVYPDDGYELLPDTVAYVPLRSEDEKGAPNDGNKVVINSSSPDVLGYRARANCNSTESYCWVSGYYSVKQQKIWYERKDYTQTDTDAVFTPATSIIQSLNQNLLQLKAVSAP